MAAFLCRLALYFQLFYYYAFVKNSKAVRVKRDYEIEVEFNVTFDEFQQIYLEPEKRRTGRGAQRRSLPL